MNLFRRFLDRRKRGAPIAEEKRLPTHKEARGELKDAIEKMSHTQIRRRISTPANSPQRVVLFDTFASICEYRYLNGSANAICKHPQHEAHGTNIARCNEQQCPFALGKVK